MTRRRLEHGGSMSPELARMLAQSHSSPRDNLITMLGDLGSEYINKTADDEKAKNKADADSQDTSLAMLLAQGRPAETQSYGDGTTINWNEQKPNMLAAEGALPADSPMRGKFLEADMQQKEAAQKANLAQQLEAIRSGNDMELAKFRLSGEKELGQQRLAAELAAIKAKPRDVQTVQTAEGVYVLNPDGSLGNRIGTPVPKGSGGIAVDPETGAITVTGNEKPLTQDQANATMFLHRMQDADKIVTEKQNAGTSVPQSVRNSIPIIGNFLISEDRQQLEQAKKNWMTANLRKESGAAISTGEFTTADKQYFPQPGDDPQTIENKKMARQAAELGMKVAAGPGPDRLAREQKKTGLDSGNGGSPWQKHSSGIKYRMLP